MEFQTATDEQDRISGWRAASMQQPVDERQSLEWLRGYRDYWAMKASKAEGVQKWLSVH